MSITEPFNIEFYKNEFQNIIKMNNDILDEKKMIHNKLSVLKQTYNNLIKNNYKKIYIFCLDSFYFQYKILSFEMENTGNFINLINNRMYGDYYKLYNIILLFCKEKNIELNIEINKDKFPVYNDLEPFFEYTINEIHNLFFDILKIIGELYNNYFNVENKIGEYKINNNNGISISNLIHTMECENSMLREQILLYLNYISFFNNIQKDYLIKLFLKINQFHKEIDEYLLSNDIECSLKQYNLYINKDKGSSKNTESSRNNSPINSLNSSRNSRLNSLQNSKTPSPLQSRFSSPAQRKMSIINKNNIINDSVESIVSQETKEVVKENTKINEMVMQNPMKKVPESNKIEDLSTPSIEKEKRDEYVLLNQKKNSIYFKNPMKK